MQTCSKFFLKIVSVIIVACGFLMLFACSSPAQSNRTTGDDMPSVVIGTMPTEDILPMWVAEEEGLFSAAGVDAHVEVFQSAQELSVALAAGEVDLAMTDVQVATSLTVGGTPVRLVWVTLGEKGEQGRFGIMTSANSGYTTLKSLAGVPVGVGSNTVPEYVFDRLMQQAGVSEDQIVGEEIKKLPVRYEMMSSGQVAAAALPASMLALGEATGMVLIADDTSGENLSQSVMVAREEFVNSEQGEQALAAVRAVWDSAATRVNESPDNYRSLLVTKASLPKVIAETYPISTYPMAALPTEEMVEPILSWMTKKGYLAVDVSYDEDSGVLSLG